MSPFRESSAAAVRAEPAAVPEIASGGAARSHRVLSLVLLLLSIVVSAAGAEALARLWGFRPWHAFELPNEPIMNEPDRLLGWQPKPGRYVFPGYTRGAPPIRFTIWPDHSRATAPVRVDRGRRVIVVGDSFTEGWAISDEQTYAWKLQERFPSATFVNYGTAGYGTYQSLLRLKLALKDTREPVPVVLYGYNDHHLVRNVAEPVWLYTLALGASRGTVFVPYCLLDAAGHLERQAPIRYPVWPLRDRSAAVTVLQQVHASRTLQDHTAHESAVTMRLLASMVRMAELHGARFAAVSLGSPRSFGRQATALARHGVPFLYCDRAFTVDTLVPGEMHPNGKMHAYWSDCIARWLADAL